MHRVAVLLLPPVVGFDATIPTTLFGAAVDSHGSPLYEVVTCALTRAPVASTTGFGIVAQDGPEVLARADTVIVPGTRFPPARVRGVLSADAAAALASVRPGTRLVSICTGAFVLAAAGLLDGRRVATHWRFADDLRALYPTVLVDENVLFVDDGDVLTSAGLAAGIDLCLHMIRADHGSQIANAVARYCVVPPWREGGQAQFIDRPLPAGDGASTGPDSCVGDASSRPAADGPGTLAARRHEPAHLQSTVPRGGRPGAGHVGAGTAPRARP